jgi:hypothetical protein
MIVTMIQATQFHELPHKLNIIKKKKENQLVLVTLVFRRAKRP